MGSLKSRSGAVPVLLLAAPVRHLPPLLFPAAAADRRVLAKVLADSHVDRQPRPPAASYLRELLAALYERLARFVLHAVHLHTLTLIWYAALAVAGLAALFALSTTAKAAWDARRGRRRKAPRQTDRAAEPPGGTPAGQDAVRDAAGWRSEVERSLGTGDVQAALRALWWWLARSLAGPRADPTWTGRELLSSARRDDLRSLVRRLDSLTYGPRPPAVEDVRQLCASLEAELP